jgi:hypothetical protein
MRFSVFYFIYFFSFLGGLRLTQDFVLAKQVLYHLIHSSSPFCSGYFGDRVLQTICPGWPQTEILLISVSQVAGIRGMSHQHLAFLVGLFEGSWFWFPN